MKVYRRSNLKTKTLLCLSLLILSAFTSVSCSPNTDTVKKSIELHLKDLGVRDVNVDLFMADPNDKSRAYASATVTYNFAKGDGQLQKEFLGYVLKQEGQDWKIERTTAYAKDEARAKQILAGTKPGAGPEGR
ncbi:MAG TPA: hypothetical protein VNH22_08925 [Blastocatellia bacterium]|jgi:hypothetical protein|nr:hypothetical protein [Blastocatellia bacterium]